MKSISFVISILFGILASSCGVNKSQDELIIGSIDEDFIAGKHSYDSIFRSQVVFPEEMKKAKKTCMLFYELIIGSKGKVTEIKIISESEPEFKEEILRCLAFVENGWRIRVDGKNKKIPYLVRGKFYFELF